MKILLCTDGSPAATRAARFGMLLARHPDTAIELLGVVEHRDDADTTRRGLEELGRDLAGLHAHCSIKVRHGHAAEQILNEAETWQADVVVIGQLGRRGLTRFLMGSTASRIVQFAPCSVLLVKGERAALNKILVCTAGGEPGLRDVTAAGQVAAAAGSQVTVLHVMSQVPLTDSAYLPDLAATAEDLMARQTREGVHLQSALAQLHAAGVPAVARVRHGFVVDEILKELREGNYDLLVAGAHRARGLTRWLLDDVTAHLVEQAAAPILVVRNSAA